MLKSIIIMMIMTKAMMFVTLEMFVMAVVGFKSSCGGCWWWKLWL